MPYKFNPDSTKTRGPKWEDSTISQRTMRRIAILHAVSSLTNEREGLPPTVSELSAATGIPRSSVYRHLQSLVESELVDIGRNDNRTGVYVTRRVGR